jgi:hypothetical protein
MSDTLCSGGWNFPYKGDNETQRNCMNLHPFHSSIIFTKSLNR